MYKIIEDCSPYYIRFTAPEHSKVVDMCYKLVDNYIHSSDFISQPVEELDSFALLSLIPLFKKLKLNRNRINIFVSQPGVYRPPHKDGADMRFGINYMIEVLDDKCVTNWYSEDLAKREDYFAGMDNNGIQTRALRELRNYTRGEAVPVKSMIAGPGECILFNVDMFHDWDNSASTNRRIVLTLRPQSGGAISFDQAKQLLFPDTQQTD